MEIVPLPWLTVEVNFSCRLWQQLNMRIHRRIKKLNVIVKLYEKYLDGDHEKGDFERTHLKYPARSRSPKTGTIKTYS
jgi:hypothetical protein